MIGQLLDQKLSVNLGVARHQINKVH